MPMSRLESWNHAANSVTPFYQPQALHASSSTLSSSRPQQHPPPFSRAKTMSSHTAGMYAQPPPLAMPAAYLPHQQLQSHQQQQQPIAGPSSLCGGSLASSPSISSGASSSSSLSKSRPKMPIKKSRSEQAKQRAVQSSLEGKVSVSRGFHAFFVPLGKSLPPAPPSSPVLNGRCAPPPPACTDGGDLAGRTQPDYFGFGSWHNKGEERWVEDMHERGGNATSGESGESGDSCGEGSMDVDSP